MYVNHASVQKSQAHTFSFSGPRRVREESQKTCSCQAPESLPPRHPAPPASPSRGGSSPPPGFPRPGPSGLTHAPGLSGAEERPALRQEL